MINRTYKIWFDEHQLFIQKGKRKIFKHALSEFPLLEKATYTQRENYNLSPFGIHWPEIDEDLSFDGLMKNRQVPRSKKPKVSL